MACRRRCLGESGGQLVARALQTVVGLDRAEREHGQWPFLERAGVLLEEDAHVFVQRAQVQRRAEHDAVVAVQRADRTRRLHVRRQPRSCRVAATVSATSRVEPYLLPYATSTRVIVLTSSSFRGLLRLGAAQRRRAGDEPARRPRRSPLPAGSPGRRGSGARPPYRSPARTGSSASGSATANSPAATPCSSRSRTMGPYTRSLTWAWISGVHQLQGRIPRERGPRVCERDARDLQRAPQRRGLREQRLDAAALLQGRKLERVLEQRVLAGEVLVDRLLGDPERPRHVLHRRAPEAVDGGPEP